MTKFKDAFAICNRALQLSKDKGRWDMGILYLRIMCMIESKNEKVYDAIEALRKTVKRLSIKKLLSDRDELIYILFKEYVSATLPNKANPKLLKILQEINLPNNKWTFYTHEPIPIDSWMMQKLQKNKI